MARSKLRIALWLFLALLLVAAIGVFALYTASQRVPEFYAEALKADPEVQREGSDEMLQQATALAGDVQRPGQWQALFTEEQINGWLAVDLPENHPDAVPPSLRDPRVAITPEGISMGCRFRYGRFESVVSLELEPYLPEPNVLAVRVAGVRAGAVPVPLGNILEKITRAAARLDFPVRWKQAEGDPVAEITIPSPPKEHDTLVRIETLRLGDGEIYLAGTTERRPPED